MNTSLLTTRELGDRLRLRPSTLRRWAIAGRIPVIRLSSRALRFDPAAVADALTRTAGRPAVSRQEVRHAP